MFQHGTRRCKSCDSKRASVWNKANPHKRRIVSRRNKLKTQYGITPEQYDAMVLAQDSKCSICFKKTKLVIDHDHSTGKIRELLCNNCNGGIGYLRDSLINLKNAVNYLETHANT